jgi:hypothetical protein
MARFIRYLLICFFVSVLGGVTTGNTEAPDQDEPVLAERIIAESEKDESSDESEEKSTPKEWDYNYEPDEGSEMGEEESGEDTDTREEESGSDEKSGSEDTDTEYWDY